MSATRLLFGTLVLLTLAGSAFAGGYVAGGTFVVKSGDATPVDNGGAICQGLSGGGVGGGCLPLPSPFSGFGTDVGFVEVVDNAADHNVAFQVCLDNNGDGKCGNPPALDTAEAAGAGLGLADGTSTNDQCRDQIFFSHADGGQFFNPLGPLPARTLEGCPNAFQGYVVLLCTGEHNDPKVGAHTHTLTAGTIALAPVGSGYGNFCGGGFGGGDPASGFGNFAAKRYVVN